MRGDERGRMPKLGVFLGLVYAEWASLVTGAFSAILIVLGIGVSLASAFGVHVPSESTIQIATWALAAICGCRAAYSVWVRAYDNRIELEHKLAAEPTLERPTHDVWLFDAIWRAYFGEWKILGEGEELPTEQEYQRFHDLAEFDISQRAFDGDLPIWGKRDALQLWEPIPKTFWQDHNIHYLSLINRNPPSVEIWSTSHPIRQTYEWIELKTSRTVVDQLWSKSPLQIIFDSSNPGRKFWSIEPIKDETGKAKGTHWEYRTLIKNNSPKTLKNVKVIVEAVGPLPHRPEPSYFDINKQPLIDLHPQAEALAVIRRWYNPPIVAGLAVGEDIYGPIKMTASADDVPPKTKFFHFDPMRTPMIWE
jgi:hypothetical protein